MEYPARPKIKHQGMAHTKRACHRTLMNFDLSWFSRTYSRRRELTPNSDLTIHTPHTNAHIHIVIKWQGTEMSAADILQLALRMEDCTPSGRNEYILKRCFTIKLANQWALWCLNEKLKHSVLSRPCCLGRLWNLRSNLAGGSMSLKTDFQNL